MPISRDHIQAVLATYLASHPDERPDLTPLQDALANRPDPTSRDTLPGHITCGAVVLNSNGGVLHIRHRALDRCLLPGGHIEQSDTTLVGAALRELHEETGLPAEVVNPLRHLDGTPLDINVHLIPASPAKDEPAHQHFDFRFAFITSTKQAVRLQTAEVTGHRWFPYEQIPSAGVAAKLGTLLSGSR